MDDLRHLDPPRRAETPPRVPRVRWGTRVLLPLALAPVLGTLVWRIDEPVYDAVRSIRASGDVARELETLGQFGGFGSILVAGVIIFCLDRGRARRLLDWLLAVLIGTVLFNAKKIAIGRGRPKLNDPDLVLGPTGEYTTPAGDVITALAGASELRAMPSSHTTHAVIAAVCLGVMYPRLRPVLYAWAALVGFLRVFHGAHWPSDVVVGALLAYPLAYVIAKRSWGIRGLDWVWCTLIDRKATPAYPALLARERNA